MHGNSDALIRELHFLGVDEASVDVLALLPLIQVAWADGEVQEAERETILETARTHYKLSQDGAALLETWLQHPPTHAYLERGRRMLVALAHSRDDFDISPEQLGDVIAFSTAVAAAAGGFLGFRSVDASEADAIAKIAAALSISSDRAVGILHFDEDIEDEATDVQNVEDMELLLATVETDRPDVGRGARLVYYADGGTQVHAVEELLTVGRSRVNTVQIGQDAEISRIHFRVSVTSEATYIEDNETTNGTWVNGERVRRRRLFGDERITAGSAQFLFLSSPV